jgi:hypothetical protein
MPAARACKAEHGFTKTLTKAPAWARLPLMPTSTNHAMHSASALRGVPACVQAGRKSKKQSLN